MNTQLTNPPRAATFTTGQVVAFHFIPVVDDTGARTGSWRCRICQRSYRQQEGRGRSNLMAHARAQHSDFEAAMRLAPVSETGSLVSWVSQRAQNRFRWISWIVEENLPFSFCEQPATRMNACLSPVSAKTLRENIISLTSAVESKIAMELPDQFGLIFDGWTHNSEHFLAIFASYVADGAVQTPLLSLAPVINKPDEQHGAETHMAAIETVLSFFGKALSHCVFFVGDNCAVNKRCGLASTGTSPGRHQRGGGRPRASTSDAAVTSSPLGDHPAPRAEQQRPRLGVA